MDNVTDEQWNAATEEVQSKVANLSEQELDQRLAEQEARQAERAKALAAENPAAQGAGDAAGDVANAADEAADAPEDAEDAAGNDAGPGMFASLLGAMFNPIDGLFILLAFFTAYKVGSGKQTD